MTPEILWSLARVSGEGMSPDGKSVLYSVRRINVQTEKGTTKQYALNLRSGQRTEIKTDKDVVGRDAQGWFALDKDALLRSTDEGKSWQSFATGLTDAENIKVSPDGRYVAFTREVLVEKMMGKDKWEDLPKTTAQVYDDLNFRHWDTWEDGKYSHVFLLERKSGKVEDLMSGMPYDCPTKPHGDAGDIMWHPQSKGLMFVTKMKTGKEYAISTNTDLYFYRLSSEKIEIWTSANKGYDMAPAFSKDGSKIAWLSMERDGFEADKNRLMMMTMDGEARPSGKPIELTKSFDESTASFIWGDDPNRIFLIAPYRGTERLFEVRTEEGGTKAPWQVTPGGGFDVAGIVGQSGDTLIVSRNDFNHAAELYAVNLTNGDMNPLTRENEKVYAGMKQSRSELRMVKTTDKKEMGVWVVYPPDFDPARKYPTLLYCQGGPQSALTQFFSYRWNFALMAAQGYIVVAPNRRGMPGWGTEWNEAISGDWGGQPMKDYLSAIDAISKEPFVDKDRRGCVGASYGGYSVYMLAGMHEGRFKSFIAHNGLFDLRSWYGTTEEMWFANWDLGGPYWDKKNAKTYDQFSPSNFVSKWNTPMLIIQGGIDFRVPTEQGLGAFKAARMQGIKSRLLYYPNENHWVLKPQNAMAWQRTFFGWLEETVR